MHTSYLHPNIQHRKSNNLLVLPLSNISAIWPNVTHGATVVIIAARKTGNIFFCVIRHKIGVWKNILCAFVCRLLCEK